MAKPRSSAAQDTLFDALCARHGATEPTDVAVCRSMAVLLSADVVTPQMAQAAAGLAALLPARQETKPWDLKLLTEKQLNVLEKLAAIARGEKPPVPEHRQKSTRYWNAVELANKIDGLALDDCGVGYAFKQLSATDVVEIRSLIMGVIEPLLAQDIFRDTFQSAYAPYVGVSLPPPVEKNVQAGFRESRSGIPVAAEAGKPAQPTGNVVPLRSWTDIV